MQAGSARGIACICFGAASRTEGEVLCASFPFFADGERIPSEPFPMFIVTHLPWFPKNYGNFLEKHPLSACYCAPKPAPNGFSQEHFCPKFRSNTHQQLILTFFEKNSQSLPVWHSCCLHVQADEEDGSSAANPARSILDGRPPRNPVGGEHVRTA